MHSDIFTLVPQHSHHACAGHRGKIQTRQVQQHRHQNTDNNTEINRQYTIQQPCSRASTPWAEVPMHNALCMQVLQGARHLQGNVQHPLHVGASLKHRRAVPKHAAVDRCLQRTPVCRCFTAGMYTAPCTHKHTSTCTTNCAHNCKTKCSTTTPCHQRPRIRVARHAPAPSHTTHSTRPRTQSSAP